MNAPRSVAPPDLLDVRVEQDHPAIAVLVPCHNEGPSVAAVVQDFRRALPTAEIYVYDNNSSDTTVSRATEAGAIVRREPRQGKGNVVRRMFADVDADIYVMVDGDGTYDAASSSSMVELLIEENLDMIVGCRVPEDALHVHRRGHAFGNAAFDRLLGLLFENAFSDAFSGFRVLSHRLVKSFPVQSNGFEIETELAAHAVEVGANWAEVPTPFRSRHEESESKLRTVRDGFSILSTAVRLFADMRPLQFFSILAFILTATSLALGVPIVYEYVNTGLVPRFPTAILAAGLQTVAFVCLTCGLILKSVARARKEARRLAYLQCAPVRPGPTRASRA
jgi:glycosyltransferase involved in cell wall biosynthesis